METKKTIIIGGGAAGLFCALKLGVQTIILERGARAGRKLSATGNGQGNLTNLRLGADDYFTSGDKSFIDKSLSRYGRKEMIEALSETGAMFSSDERGRVYPASRQASSVTDLLRYNIAGAGKKTITSCNVYDIKKNGGVFSVFCEENGERKVYRGDCVVLCSGGKAAKNFGTDGNGYMLARKAGHTITSLYPSLVQLKTDTEYIKTLRGIRVCCAVTAFCGKNKLKTVTGDVIFTEYGISGDAVFRISAYITDKIERGVMLSLDFMPETEKKDLAAVLARKRGTAALPEGELFCGILNNQLGRAVLKRAETENRPAEDLVKNFTLRVSGTLGFDYAQVTKGGIPLCEITPDMESRLEKNLYFAGEILDVDGQCGGYNLQWAFTSASIAAETINNGR